MPETPSSGRWKRLPTLERVPRMWGDPGPLVRLLTEYDSHRTPTVRPIGNLTSTRFVQLLQQSGLVEEKVLATRLKSWDDELAESGGWAQATGVDLAQRLVASRLLTVWQAEKLLSGKYKGFSLANYRMVELLGVSQWAAVYRAEHQMMRRAVAMEVLSERIAAQPGARQRFFRYSRRAAELDHPNLVHVFDIGEEREMCYAVMEYVAGYDLQRLVRRLGPLPLDVSAGIARQVAGGLLAIHAARHAMGGLRPRHIVVDPNGTAHILTMRFNGTAEEPVASTVDPAVVPRADDPFLPASWHPASSDRQRDAFALGALMYYLLLGESPAIPAVGDANVPPRLDLSPLEDRPDFDADLAGIIESLATLSSEAEQGLDNVAKKLTDWLATTGS
jgi:eukaryotic-like serine/threonine-protein kinase